MLIHDLDSNLRDEDIRIWLDSDSNDPGYQLLSDEDIISNITSPNQSEDSSEEEEGDADTHEIPTCGAVADVRQMHGLVRTTKRKHCIFTTFAQKIRHLAATKRYSNLKQLTLFSFTKS